MTRAPYSAEFAHPAASATVRLAWDLDGRLVYATDGNQGSDLLDGRMAELLTVHDPRGYPPKVVGKRLAERPEALDGKLVYLVDCLFDNSENFMRELEDWFGKNLPAVKTRLIQPRQSWVDDAEVRAKVAREGDGAILGVGL